MKKLGLENEVKSFFFSPVRDGIRIQKSEFCNLRPLHFPVWNTALPSRRLSFDPTEGFQVPANRRNPFPRVADTWFPLSTQGYICYTAGQHPKHSEYTRLEFTIFGHILSTGRKSIIHPFLFQCSKCHVLFSFHVFLSEFFKVQTGFSFGLSPLPLPQVYHVTR